MNSLDWTDPNCKISNHFSVKECLFLPTWNRMANLEDGLNDEIKNNLVSLCYSMDIIRDYLNCPINVHCTYRPGSYSTLVGGSSSDVHTKGLAMDFDCNPIKSSDEIKKLLIPCLEQWSLRMENNGPGSNWIHIDIAPVMYSRYFNT